MTDLNAQQTLSLEETPPPPPPLPEYAGKVLIDRNYENRSTLTKASVFIQDYGYTLNPYSGCAFGCGYCYAAAFVSEKPDKDGNPSPYRRKNWVDWVRIKKNAVKQIAKAVHDNKLDGKAVYMSSVTDPYQPTEHHTRQTNLILQELAEARNLGLVIQTRGPLADNNADIDLCKAIVANGGKVQVNMTITTNDEAVRRACERTCPSYRQRLNAIVSIDQKVRDTEGYTTCITMTPLLPAADPEGFARDLADSGIDRFIIQPVHTAQPAHNKGFPAMTRNELVWQLGEYWNYNASMGIAAHTAVRERYAREYQQALETILPALAGIKAKVGFGRIGFSRPWKENWHLPPEKWPRLYRDEEQ